MNPAAQSSSVSTLPLCSAGHQLRIVNGLLSTGWTIQTAPDQGRLLRNGQKYILTAPGHDIKLRIFVYKVTGSGRSRPSERRIEITTTYKSGLRPARGYHDVVIGYCEETDTFVGVDPRRLKFGGDTHNASSFFDLEGITTTSDNRMLVLSRRAHQSLFSGEIEYHAFFNYTKLAEYLFNFAEIHNGTYANSGLFSEPSRPGTPKIHPPSVKQDQLVGSDLKFSTERKPQRTVVVNGRLVSAVENADYKKLKGAKITPEKLREILRHCDEIGALAEQFVVDGERRRLRRLGHVEAASKVQRVSLISVGEGYDIRSFENDGKTERFLEVKGTTGKSMTVDISNNEWETAKQLQGKYYLVRVICVKTSPQSIFYHNPASLESSGAITKLPTGWRVKLPKIK